MNIEEFYAEDERRRVSVEIEFGRDWRDAKGVRYELCWVQDTGELYVDSVDLDGLVIRKLAVITTHERVEEILVGWPEAMGQADGVEWIIEHLTGAGVLDS